ncbi:ComF family protein [Aquibacillus salsiterrae]|uniref:ComF family protein n=1 Tax=Aquibacillus salsiterrae TaxID=2950439 RepID=A0A9X4ADY6_9BACI|nr:ComF family protein [Aquibacillus salsiterrae]MDC3416122.1 ComF family protein [Aquibacillus salsiterrae]
MHCLWCDKQIIVEVTWDNFLYPDKPKKLCIECKSQLTKITGAICKLCGRKSEDEQCKDCERWGGNRQWSKVLSFNRSVYSYNPMLQAMIAKWKYRGDYQLVEAFQTDFREAFKQIVRACPKDTVVVPIPLSDKRRYERAFNQAEALTQLLEVPYQCLLTRREGEKQSKKTRQERLSSTNPFQIIEVVRNPIILIDDIYTTGITIRHAAKCLIDAGCPTVYSFTLAR